MSTVFFDENVITSAYLSEKELDILADFIRRRIDPVIGDFRLEAGKATILKFYPTKVPAGLVWAEVVTEIERDTVRRYFFINEGEKIGYIDLVLGKDPNQTRVKIESLLCDHNKELNLLLLSEFVLVLKGNLTVVEKTPPIDSKNRKDPGRHHSQEDEWANNEIWINGRDPNEVYKEWLEKSAYRELVLPKDQWRNVKKSNFLEKGKKEKYK